MSEAGKDPFGVESLRRKNFPPKPSRDKRDLGQGNNPPKGPAREKNLKIPGLGASTPPNTKDIRKPKVEGNFEIPGKPKV